MELTPEIKDLIVMATNLRGGIKCQITKEISCGYIIRPELWFNRTNESILRALHNIGVEARGSYSKPDEISLLLEAIDGLEDLSPTAYGIEMVRATNGEITQPTTHDEVVATISRLEQLLGVRC